ncbi:MAG TPA: nucleoid occlusion factor SlmA, partial [Acidiferrobacteraceae bacterium]|nr:nucleoid occlusion factor SlmA [Acidiferrobacteraceae bacterium]
MPRTAPGERRQAILEAVAHMLEQDEAVTTAALARRLEVSEAALYRHFPSKARMFEALLDFVEESLFPRLAAALGAAETSASERYLRSLWLVLAFVEKNPGLARLLHGEGLAGESERVRARGTQVLGKIDAQLRQALRESEWRGELLMP